jgi:hypothetical protein
MEGGGGGGDIPLRQETFAKYFPGEEFENYTPFFEDDEAGLTLEQLSA